MLLFFLSLQLRIAFTSSLCAIIMLTFPSLWQVSAVAPKARSPTFDLETKQDVGDSATLEARDAPTYVPLGAPATPASPPVSPLAPSSPVKITVAPCVPTSFFEDRAMNSCFSWR